MKTINPWKGVVPYSNDPEDLLQHPFRGRGKAISDFLLTISNHEITTLYGQSGIGKTSLLNAGVFPKLRTSNCWPISIRLYNDSIDKHYAKYIVSQLQSIAVSSGSEVAEGEDCSNRYLWNFFAHHDFYENGVEVIPVVVLDQFEEVLRNTPDEALILLRQLREAKQEVYGDSGLRFEVNFRIVISIREDDLYLLENALDQHFIDKMKTGRYRLQPVDRESADEIIFIRDGIYGNITESEKNTIADTLIGMATQDGSVSSLLLSLVCSMAYMYSADGIITLETIKALGDNPLLSFYKESISNLPKDFVDYLEDTFVDYDRRRIIPKDRIPGEFLPYVKQLSDERYEHRILTVSSDRNIKGESYELIHDKLADAISKYHDERLAEYASGIRKKQIKYWSIALVSLFVVLIVSSWIIKKTNAPISFRSQDYVNYAEIPVYSRGYYVRDSVLSLSNCTVEDYTFYGNPEVKKVCIDGVGFSEYGLFLPNVDTIEYGPNQWGYETPSSSFPRASVVVARRPKRGNFALIRYPHLDTVIIEKEDKDFFLWDSRTKTLLVRNSPGRNFNPVLSRHKEPMYLLNDSLLNGYNHIVRDVDIASIPASLEYPSKSYFRLVNSDSMRRVLHRSDIPESILEKTRFIDLKYVDTLCAGVFSNCNIVNANFPDVKFVGPRAFMETDIEDYISLPQASIISDSSFYKSSLDTIRLESALSIGYEAFKQRYNSSKAKKIILPKIQEIAKNAFENRIDDNTSLSYNINAGINPEIAFGKKFSNQTTALADDNSQAKGYHVEGHALIVDSTVIKHLHVGYGVIDIKNKFNNVSIDKITARSSDYHSFHSTLYSGSRTVLIMSDSETLVSLPAPGGMSDELKNYSNAKCKKFICLDRRTISILNNTKDVVLYVPYGQKKTFYAFSPLFKDVVEMSWIKTLYYKTFYGINALRISFFIDTIDFSDISFVLICVLALFLSWYYLKKRQFISAIWWRDMLFMALIVSLAGYLVSPNGLLLSPPVYITTDGESFFSVTSLFNHLKETDAIFYRKVYLMWPTLLIAPPIWMLYLFILHRIKWKKEEKHHVVSEKSE